MNKGHVIQTHKEPLEKSQALISSLGKNEKNWTQPAIKIDLVMENYLIKTNWSMEHVAKVRSTTPVTRK